MYGLRVYAYEEVLAFFCVVSGKVTTVQPSRIVRVVLCCAVLMLLLLAPHLPSPSLVHQGALLGKEPKPYASFDEAVKTRLKSVTMWGGMRSI